MLPRTIKRKHVKEKRQMNSEARQVDGAYRNHEDAVLAGVPANMVVHTADDFFCSEDDVVECAECTVQMHDRSELDDDFLCPTCASEPDWQADESAAWGQQRGCNTARGR